MIICFSLAAGLCVSWVLMCNWRICVSELSAVCKTGSIVAVLLCPRNNYSFITRMLLNHAIDSGAGCPLTMEVLPVSGAVSPAFGSAEIEQLSCVIFYISSLLVRKNLVQWCGCVCVLAQPCQPRISTGILSE